MHDKSAPTRLTPPAPDEVVLPLPREMTPTRWAVRIAIWLAVSTAFFVLLRFDLPMMLWRDRVFGGQEGLLRRFDLLKQIVQGFREFGQAMVMVVALIVAAAYDRRRRFIILGVLLAQLLAMAVYDPVKWTVVRYRPEAAGQTIGELSTLTAGQMWDGWRFVNRGVGGQSFPSGHSAAAFAFAGVLVWFYPRLRWLFWTLAAGCAVSRYVDGVHWPSDCLAGAVVGYCSAWLALRPYAWVLPIIWYRRRVKRRQARAAVRGATRSIKKGGMS